MAFSTVVLLLLLIAVVSAFYYLLQKVGTGVDREQNQSRPSWQAKLTRFREYIWKVFPMSAIRIFVVAAQIVVQVCSVEE